MKKRLCLGDWKPVLDKHENKLGCWQGRNLVISGRSTLINSSLASILLYMLSFYRIPAGIKHKVDMIESRFLWSGDKNKKKYHLVNWSTVCMPRDQGGLGILDLELMNISLLSKWLWKLFNDSGPWQDFLWKKYLNKSTLGQVTVKNGDSHFWQGLMDVKKLFWPCCKIIVGNGARTRFWEDIWLRDKSLAEIFSDLYSVPKPIYHGGKGITNWRCEVNL